MRGVKSYFSPFCFVNNNSVNILTAQEREGFANVFIGNKQYSLVIWVEKVQVSNYTLLQIFNIFHCLEIF